MPPTPLPDVSTLLPLPPAVFHILVSLAGGDAHGYAIMQEVATRAGVRLGPGTLYTTVRRLLEQGLIVERRRPPAPLRTTRAGATTA